MKVSLVGLRQKLGGEAAFAHQRVEDNAFHLAAVSGIQLHLLMILAGTRVLLCEFPHRGLSRNLKMSPSLD
jgi:hypothetical protein